MIGLREKRRYPRARVELPVFIGTAEGIVEGLTLDVSAGGASIRCQSPPQLYEVFEMIIKVPELGRSLVVEAEVIWSTADLLENELMLPIMGVRFTRIADNDRLLIATAVEKLVKNKKLAPDRVVRARKVLAKVLKDCVQETSEKGSSLYS